MEKSEKLDNFYVHSKIKNIQQLYLKKLKNGK